jgi:anti-sigma factor ChrR (cupin superfamily)
MKASLRVTTLVLVALIAAFTLSAGGGGKLVVWQAGDVKWTPSPAMKGLSTATLWGDPSKGAYGALKKAEAGTEFPWHTHSSDQKIVGVSGTWDFQSEGGEMKVLESGSYLFVPAGMKHMSKCHPEADCVYFEEAPGKSDYILAK